MINMDAVKHVPDLENFALRLTLRPGLAAIKCGS